MRKVIFGMQITLDGYISGPNSELDWVVMDPEVDHAVLPDLIERADAVLLGKNLFQGFASFWPDAESVNPNINPTERMFARWIDRVEKIVFSKSLESAS